ncbi:MAG TPA: hypothetical protein ENK50_05410 [Sedimenticola sp.]|nr:hypothetical protein [Sedimenticola sp.]
MLEALRQSRRFRGVQLHRCGCRASIRLLGRFFSFRNAPRLPLAQCDAEICSCTYLGIVDRRRTERRAEPVPVKLSRMEQERRASIDRRRPSDVWHGRDR